MVLVFGLEWDSIRMSQIVSESFSKLGLTDKKGIKLNSKNITMGFADSGKSAMIVEGFDLKNMWGLVVQVANDEKTIRIYGGKFNKEHTVKLTYNEKFDDLSKASSYFEGALTNYKEILNVK